MAGVRIPSGNLHDIEDECQQMKLTKKRFKEKNMMKDSTIEFSSSVHKLAKILKPGASDLNNSEYLVSMPSSAGKPWLLASMWM